MTGAADRTTGPARATRPGPVFLAVVGAVTLLAGCVVQQQPPTTPRLALVAVAEVRVEAADITTVGDSTALALPADRYLWSTQDNERVRRAEQTLLADCLARYELALPDTPTQPDIAPATPTARRYGLTARDEAATAGYRLPAALAMGDRRRPAPVETDADVSAVLRGTVGRFAGHSVPAGGCQAEADHALGGGVPIGVSDIAQDLNGQSWTLSTRHPLVERSFAAWSACMRSAGFTYPDPMAAMNDDRFTGTPSTTEITTAKHDVACKRAHNTTGVWYSVEVAVQRALIDRNRPALTAAERAKTEQLARADQVRTDPQ